MKKAPSQFSIFNSQLLRARSREVPLEVRSSGGSSPAVFQPHYTTYTADEPPPTTDREPYTAAHPWPPRRTPIPDGRRHRRWSFALRQIARRLQTALHSSFCIFTLTSWPLAALAQGAACCYYACTPKL